MEKNVRGVISVWMTQKYNTGKTGAYKTYYIWVRWGLNLNMLNLQEPVSRKGDSWNILVNVVKKLGFIYASLK